MTVEQNSYLSLQQVSACLVKLPGGYAPRLTFNMRPKEKLETVSLVGIFALGSYAALKSSPYIQFDAESAGSYKYPVQLVPKRALLTALSGAGNPPVTLNVVARILPYKDRNTLSLGGVTQAKLLTLTAALKPCGAASP